MPLSLPHLPATRRAFWEWALPLARNTAQRWGVPWQIVAAQASVESSFGTSAIARNAKNYFGIHGQGPAGSVTCEIYRAQCRAYNTPQESFDDHGRFLRQNGLYDGAFQFTDDPYRFITYVWTAGYAEAPGYARDVAARMREVDPSLPPPSAELVAFWRAVDSTARVRPHGLVVDPVRVPQMRPLIAQIPATVQQGGRPATVLARVLPSRPTAMLAIAGIGVVMLGWFAVRGYRSR